MGQLLRVKSMVMKRTRIPKNRLWVELPLRPSTRRKSRLPTLRTRHPLRNHPLERVLRKHPSRRKRRSPSGRSLRRHSSTVGGLRIIPILLISTSMLQASRILVHQLSNQKKSSYKLWSHRRRKLHKTPSCSRYQTTTTRELCKALRMIPSLLQ